jgi:hypothetical protein
MIAMFRFIDDFSYYPYHRVKYDTGITAFTSLSWNLTNAKWNIPCLDSLYKAFDISYADNLPESPTEKTPVTYLVLNENAMFLEMTEDFWLRSLMIVAATFAMLHLVFRGLNSCNRTRGAANFIRKFSLWSFLLVSLMGENVQYFSFRCFSQVYELGVREKGLLVNLLVNYMVLFLVILYAVGSFYFLPYFSPCTEMLL